MFKLVDNPHHDKGKHENSPVRYHQYNLSPN